MQNTEIKKAIVLDLDETLETGSSYREIEIMTLRPNIDLLINKLNFAKLQGIDIVICTTATSSWVNRFLELKPEFKEIIDKIYCRDNKNEWYNFDEEKNPIEYSIMHKSTNINGKPVTTFGYNSVLLIDDNRMEYDNLENLFKSANSSGNLLQKDISYFSGFSYKLPDIYTSLKYINAIKENPEFYKIFLQYINYLRSENGISYMCSAIDSFIKKDFIPGLSNIDETYSKDYYEHIDTLRKIEIELRNEVKKYKLDKDYVNNFADSFFNSDKHLPFQGIEEYIKPKKEQLNDLVEEAKALRKQLSEKQKTEKIGSFQEERINEIGGKDDE